MEEKREEEVEELKAMLDLFLLFFSKKEEEVFRLREVDMLSWNTIASITGRSSEACRKMFCVMQDKVKTIRGATGKFKKYNKRLKDLEVWENLSPEQKEKVVALSAKGALEEAHIQSDRRRKK